MKKELKIGPNLFPMPMLMIATYNEDDTVDVMPMAWGGICGENMVSLNLEASHKTCANLKKRGAFTISVADIPHLKESDYFGIASANTVRGKFEKSGMHSVKSEKLDAPIVEEYPLTLECKVALMEEPIYGGYHVLGEIVGVLADESVLDEKGRIDAAKLNAFVFDQFRNGYYAVGEKVGQAWSSGAALYQAAKD